MATLYYLAGSPRSNWLVPFVAEAGLDVKCVLANDNADFASAFPLRKAPAFVSAEGVTLNETIAIGQYLAEGTPLAGQTPLERAQISRWVAFLNGDVSVPMVALYTKTATDPAAEMEKLRGFLAYFDAYLANSTFISGGKTHTWADILCLNLAGAYIKMFPEGTFKNISRWLGAVVAASPAAQAIAKAKAEAAAAAAAAQA